MILALCAILMPSIGLQTGPALTGKYLTLTDPSLSASAICNEISSQDHVQIECAQKAGAELFTVRLDNAPLDQVMAHLELAGRLKLEWDGAKYVLKQDEAQIAADENKILQKRADDLRETIKLAEQQLRNTPFNQEAAQKLAVGLGTVMEASSQDIGPGRSKLQLQVRQTELQTPMGQCFLKLIKSIPVDQIARLERMEAIWISSSPTPSELAFQPGVAEEAVKTLQPDQAVWVKAVNENPQYYQGYRKDTASASPIPSIGAVELEIIGRTNLFSLSIFDKTGKLVSGILLPLYDSKGTWEMSTSHFDSGASQADPITVPYKAAQKTLTATLSTWPNATVLKEAWANEGTRQYLTDPVKWDPYSQLIGEPLTDWAANKGTQLISQRDNSLIAKQPAALGFGTGGVNIEQAHYNAVHLEDGREENGWLTSKVSDPAEIERDSMDFGALKSFFNETLKTNSVDFRSLCRLAFGFASLHSSSVCSDYLGALKVCIPDLKNSGIMSITDWDQFGFLGSLTDEQWAEALASGLPLSQVSQKGLYLLRKNLQLTALDRPAMPNHGVNTIFSEFPVALPHGLPGNGRLYLQARDIKGIDVITAGEDNLMSASDFVAVGAGYVNSDDFNGLKAAAGQSLTLRFEWPGGVEFTSKIDMLNPTGKQVNSISDLPAEYQPPASGGKSN